MVRALMVNDFTIMYDDTFEHGFMESPVDNISRLRQFEMV